MAYQIERGPAFPYPLRASSFVEQEGAFEPQEPLVLGEKEKKELLDFEEKLFEKLQRIKKIKINTHDVYPAALRSGVGKAMVELMYKQGTELHAWMNEIFESVGIPSEKKDDEEDEDSEDTDKGSEDDGEIKAKRKKLKREMREATFQDIFESGQLKSGAEINFNKLSKIVSEERGEEVEIKRTFEYDDGEIEEEEVREAFEKFDPKSIHLSWRLRIHWFTDEWAREKTSKDFRDNNGDLGRIENLNKLCKLTHPERNLERLDGLRLMKREIQNMTREYEQGSDDLELAKVFILDIYRKYINKQLADDMLLWIGSGKDGKEIFDINPARMERYDRFLHGVGEEFDKRGNRVALTERINEIVRDIDASSQTEPTLEVDMTSDDEIRIAQWILKEYGFIDCDVLKRKSAQSKMGMAYTKKRAILYIPKSSKKDLVAYLTGVAHEIEGHLLSHRNWDAVDLPLTIMKRYPAGGRDEVLEEAGAKYVEDVTMKRITGNDNYPENIYLQGIELRKKGGTFRDCLDLFFNIRAKRLGKSKQDVFRDGDIYGQVFEYAYDRAMRLLREHTSLDDKSGRVTTTDQLKYLEQKKVAESLVSQGMEEVLFVNGFDVYSVKQLLELGIIDKTKVRRPKMVVANKIWPILRDGLARGLTVKQILDEQGVE
ncbi:hypothetical protein A3K29_00270 [Candidatus Collierbacteria bacterium RIFOXYB2_FULL_46_14]|nr:MAG: hypothetical protein A3K29_00270 [Candidatus Collierbacteria bacterium RIFOXYB2_FULL_46_14]OGD75615.1 MAG: hypothetical protein A3K43_00270 [Candidatus Collierbacteria bacterium RIFOXYA2_FULL_46_20]OGD76951.1 MAG: hypothetical protein A3K39_00270 [Candidatus Collierbacteria bacterium RIFOXYC2_FULL_43_15]OGD80242.1 MAG: hypothetical protein A2320_00760 [Pseudomonadales bacterium GWC2_63_15]OGD81673.1 MAG: hypothetical protein A3K36_00270 [Candidatus Collierbacteria bacterium RIFOXYD2_FUL